MGRFLTFIAVALLMVAVAGGGSSFAQDKGQIDPTAAPKAPPKSIFDTAVSKPTGKNGYEDYARAADAMSEQKVREAGMAVRTSSDKAPPLAAKRAWVAAGRRVLALVRTGNQKPISDPRATLGPSTLLPEFTWFKQIAQLFAAEARVRLADGNAAGAVQSILDCLTFCDRIGHFVVVGSLVGMAGTGTALAEVEAELGFLSQREALTLANAANQLLRQPPGLVDALNSELVLFLSGINVLFDDFPNTVRELGGNGSDQAARFAAEAAKLSPAEMEDVERRTVSTMRIRWQGMIDLMKGPEQGWIVATDRDPAPTSLEQFVAQTALPLFDNVFVAAARVRTQLRLLRLHGAIVSFQWEHHRLPAKLDELGLPEIIADPVLGKPFHYELSGPNGYRLWSDGWGTIGKIELKYQRPIGAENDEPQVP